MGGRKISGVMNMGLEAHVVSKYIVSELAFLLYNLLWRYIYT